MTATLTIAFAVAALASSAAIAQAPPRSTTPDLAAAAATTMAPGPATAAANTAPAPVLSAPAAGHTHAMEGLAAYYAKRLDGRRTAGGKSFNQNALVAAHRTLPFGTKVRVVNKKNGRSVTVRIVDRGPTEPARVIDLSRAAASKLGMRRRGVVPVKLEVVPEAPAGKAGK